MKVIKPILRELDQRKFLGFSIWEFSFRSLSRSYGRFFLREIVLRHPLRTLRGLWDYRQVTGDAGAITRLFSEGDEEFVQQAAGQEDGFLVALGFCQKPLGDGANHSGCPVGRFNHECATLERSDPFVKTERLPLPCRSCEVRTFGLAALRAGAAFYVMTSAADIGRDILVPIIDRARFRRGIFLLCPYSVPAFSLPLCIGQMKALFAAYGTGDCRDYGQFIRADEGQKDERTCLSPATRAQVMSLLASVSATSASQPPRRFRREGELFVPATDSSG
ncbi:MAG: hypothetical protein SVX38_01895 [Chloroflexota bacterium]|nr:hypothetical protein [Chloroflexota bacterium]